ncbi:hypothetical protein HCN51_40320 [Nonomuraea sp. FMUSA5-5]|uniref:Uncharacterized protein n=1 Tax=Nonomuraea composti TaxID=2720023 RepID=A0ABX1BLF0_9ACTN|nr:hypothetical protein [Nonomuraea sp. FMUSA5-5]NJP95608.1 hypothetical protein [Nonomuraea sp. FMUSA5-5]
MSTGRPVLTSGSEPAYGSAAVLPDQGPRAAYAPASAAGSGPRVTFSGRARRRTGR